LSCIEKHTIGYSRGEVIIRMSRILDFLDEDGYRYGLIVGMPIFIVGLFYESFDHLVGSVLMLIGGGFIFIVTLIYSGEDYDESEVVEIGEER